VLAQTTHSKKEEVIKNALVHKGIVFWGGIPEHIIEELKIHGYKIKKRKHWHAEV
jgi:hypothetical protein